MSDGISLGRNGKFGNIDLSKIKGNIDINKLSSGAQKIANIFDRNNDGKLQQSELKNLFQQVQNYGNDNNISKKESRNIFNNNSIFASDTQTEGVETGQQTTPQTQISGNDGLQFLQELSDQKANVATTSTNAKGETVITYKPNEKGEVITETYNGDNLVSKTIKDANNKITTEEYGPDEQITSRKTVDPKTNTTTEETFEGGKLKESKETNSSGETIYKDGEGNITKKETKLPGDFGFEVEYYENGQVTKKETTDVNGKLLKQETKNSDGTTTTTEYDADGQVKNETVKDASGKVVKQTEKKPDGTSVEKEFDSQGNVTKETTKDSTGKISSEKTVNEDGSTTETKYNSNQKAVSQTITKGNETFTVEYDGEGNTMTAVQNGESPAVIAKKFGCSVDDLLRLNADQLKGPKGSQYFLVGAKIKIPGELSADSKALAGRVSSEEAVGDYKTFVKEKTEKEIAGKEKKEVTVDKDYNSMWDFATELLKKDGITNPTKQQITDKMNELISLNGNKPPKKGDKITTLVTESDIKAREAEQRQIQENHDKNWKEGAELSAALYKDMKGWGTSNTFDAHLNQITEDNASAVVLSFKESDSSESIAECIMDEKGMDIKKRLSSVETIFNKLLGKAQKLGIDTTRYKSEFNQAKESLTTTMTVYTQNYQNGGIGSGVRQEKTYVDRHNFEGFDKAIEGLAAAIEGTSSMTSVDKAEVENMTAEARQNMVTDELSSVAAEARDSYNTQRDHEGWASAVANGVSWVWGSENRPKYVEADLDKFDQEVAVLEKCKTEAEFQAKFKEIFGVDYNPAMIKAYQKQHEAQQIANGAYSTEQSFNTTMSGMLKNANVYDDVMYLDGGQTVVTRTAESKYNEFENNFVNMMSSAFNSPAEARQALMNKMSEMGITKDSTTQQKYTALRQISQEYSQILHQNTLDTTNGEGYEAFSKKSERMYTAAFGATNDIAERVQEYNRSTQIGEAVVKGATKAVVVAVATVVTCGAGGVAVLGAAGSVMAAGGLTFVGSAAIDITDRTSSNDGLQDGELEQILKSAAVDGVAAMAGVGIGKAIKAIRDSASILVKTSAEMGGNTAVATLKDAANGQVTVDGVIINFICSKSTGAIKEITIAGKTFKAGAALTKSMQGGVRSTAKVVDKMGFV